MRFSGPIAVLAATAAAAVSAAATADGTLVEAHPLARTAVDAVGWRVYASVSLLLLAAGIRALSALPLSTWGVRAIAGAKVVDALRDAWLTWPLFASGDLVVPRGTVATIIVVGALSAYLVTGPANRWRSRRTHTGKPPTRR